MRTCVCLCVCLLQERVFHDSLCHWIVSSMDRDHECFVHPCILAPSAVTASENRLLENTD